MHKCGQCGKLLQTAAALRNHMFIHTGEKPWQCEKCPAVFRLYSTLYDHKKVSHVPGGKFKCPECPCRFTAQLGLKRHVGIYHPRVDPDEVNHAQDAPSATNNAKNVKNSGGVMLHQAMKKRAPALTAVISEDGTRTYPCEYCHKVFNKSQNLRSHLPVHTGERNSVCNMCGVAFKSSSNLLAHKKVSHVEGGSHKCEKCPCVFASFLGLVRHKRLFHGKSQMMTKKAKQAKSKTVVKLPVQVQLEEEAEEEESENMEVWDEGGNDQAEGVDDTTEDADDKGTYECNQCGKVLSSLLCLRNHQMIHTGEKPWICSLCGAAFRLNSTLYGHKKTSHVPNGPYKCDECSCRFAAVFGLKRHKICFHEGGEASPLAVVESPGKISKCSQCPKAFKSAAALQEHMRSHIAEVRHPVVGGRTVQCPKCRGTYSTSRALKKHMRTAHIPGGKKCSMCTCSFISLQALKAHAAKVHGRSGVSSLKVEQPVLAAVKALKSRGVTVEPTHGSSDDLSYDDEKPYPCDRCGKNFTTDTSLKNHQRYCAQETIACDICGESFSIYSNMIRHKRTCHVPNGPYKCSMCTHCYSTTRGYSRHMAHAHGEYKTKPGLPVKHGMAKPGVALQRIIDNSKMRTMVAQQQKRPYHRIPEALRKYRCTLCGNTFSTTGNFKKHMITSHVPGGKFPCSFCACVFNTYNALNSHVGNRHSTKFNDSAPVATSRKTVIAKPNPPKRVSLPIQKVSPPKPATPMLSKIKFNFLKPPTSLLHPTSAPTPPKRKPPTELMKRMARIVGGSSPPKDLPLLLPRPIPPLAKVKVEAEEAPQNEYSNDDDDDGYNAEYGAGSSELLLGNAEHPRCEICGKSYSNMHSLRGHMTVHTGEKPFPCNLCGQRFRQKGDVVSHKKTNHTDGRFKCNLCPCRFTTPQGLKRHRVHIHHTNVDGQQLKPFKSHPLASIMKPKVEKAEPTETYSKVTLAFGSPSAPSPVEPKPVVHKIKQGREYECDLCDASFNHQQNLMRHRKSSHVPWGEFKCSTCSCSFVSPTSLRTHEAIFHQRKSGKNPGLVKPKSFMQTTPMMRPVPFLNKQHSQHQQMQSLKRKILHPNIGSLSRTPKVLKDARGRPSYVCELCGATFATHSICVKHLNTSHVEGGQYGCGQCICIFNSKQGLARHETVYHSGRKGEQRLVSSIAQMRKFEIEVEPMESEDDNGGEHYGDHGGMYGNHFEEEDEEEIMMGHDSGNCEMDPLDTTSSSREDHDEDEYFASRVKVEAAAVYSDEEGTDPMSEQLNDSSNSPTDNKDEGTSSGDGDRPHGTVYGTAGALPKGRVNRFAVYAKKDQHVCGICKLSFTQAASLKGHMRIHTGDKPYQCRFCGICFRLNGTLATHVKKCHEQENPYQCEFCSCSFITPGVLTQHILKFHPAQIKEETA